MALKRNVYNNWTELQKEIGGGGGTGDAYTKAETDTLLAEKQNKLTAGTNITIANNVISADVTGYVTKTYVDNADNILQNKISTEVTSRTNADNTLQTNINNEVKVRSDADSTLQTNIDNEITNRTIADNELDTKKQDKLTASTGIDITDNVIKSTLINDTVKSELYTYSSNKIQSLLDALSKAKIKVVDSQPVLPEDNTLYYIGTASPYDIKLYTDNTWYDMGTTEVDLSNYYKKTETYSQDQIDEKYDFLSNSISVERTTRSDKDTTLQENIDKKQNKLTADTGLKIENDTISVDLTTIVDKLYPIGTVVVMNQAPGLGTWTDITDSYSNRYLRLGTYGELSEEALPIPDMTIAEAGAHTHTLTAMKQSSLMNKLVGSTGAMGSNGTITTSESGAHTHTLTAAAGGVYQDGAAVQPLGFGIRIFQRTA